MTEFKFNDPARYRFVGAPEIELDIDYLELVKYIKDNSKELKQMISSMLEQHKDNIKMAVEYEKVHRLSYPELYE